MPAPSDRFLLGLLALSLTGNVYQATVTRRLPSAPPPRPTVGQVVPDIEAQSLSGAPVVVRYAADADRPVWVYVFSQKCVWCQRNNPNLKAAMDASRGRYRFIGISVDSADPSPYLATNGLRFDQVLVRPSAATTAAFDLTGTPQSWIISPKGVVENNLSGAWFDSVQEEVEERIGAPLPGVLPDAAPPTKASAGAPGNHCRVAPDQGA